MHRASELGFKGQGVGLLQPGIGCRSVHSVRMGSGSGRMRRFSLLEESGTSASLLEESSTSASLLEESGTSASLLEESTERMWPVSAGARVGLASACLLEESMDCIHIVKSARALRTGAGALECQRAPRRLAGLLVVRGCGPFFCSLSFLRDHLNRGAYRAFLDACIRDT